MAEKMTKKDWYGVIKGIVEASDYENKAGAVEFIDHQIELLANRSNGSKPTKDQRANVEFRKNIAEALRSAGRAVTVTELMAVMPAVVLTAEGEIPVTNQKVSALLRQMKLNGEVVRTEDKKKAYFALAE